MAKNALRLTTAAAIMATSGFAASPALADSGPATPSEGMSQAVRSGSSMPMPHDSGMSPDHMGMSPTHHAYLDLLRQLEGRPLETTFMAGMIHHHQMAIDMAQLELQKGSSPKVRALAQRIIDDQQREIDTMTRWLQQWYGLTPDQALAQSPARALLEQMSTEMHPMMMEPLMAAAPGKATDVAFLQLMIPHHMMAVMEANAARPGTQHRELKELERSISRSQTREIAYMQRLIDRLTR